MGCCGDTYWRIVDLLRENGAVERRSKKHRHWVFPDGFVWIVPNSPKSSSGYYHNLADLKKQLRRRRTEEDRVLMEGAVSERRFFRKGTPLGVPRTA
jgi:hypothetical protein